MSVPIQFVCEHCGSNDILTDAWARWNVETQEMELSSVMDAEECVHCGGETSTRSIPADTICTCGHDPECDGKNGECEGHAEAVGMLPGCAIWDAVEA